jgi:hypothetical protein
MMLCRTRRQPRRSQAVAKPLPVFATADRIKMEQPLNDRLVVSWPLTEPFGTNPGKEPVGLLPCLVDAANMGKRCGAPGGTRLVQNILRAFRGRERAFIVSGQEMDIELVGPVSARGRATARSSAGSASVTHCSGRPQNTDSRAPDISVHESLGLSSHASPTCIAAWSYCFAMACDQARHNCARASEGSSCTARRPRSSAFCSASRERKTPGCAMCRMF